MRHCGIEKSRAVRWQNSSSYHGDYLFYMVALSHDLRAESRKGEPYPLVQLGYPLTNISVLTRKVRRIIAGTPLILADPVAGLGPLMLAGGSPNYARRWRRRGQEGD